MKRLLQFKFRKMLRNSYTFVLLLYLVKNGESFFLKAVVKIYLKKKFNHHFYVKVLTIKLTKANETSSESDYALKIPRSMIINQDFVHFVPGQQHQHQHQQDPLASGESISGSKQSFHQYDKFVENEFKIIENNQEPPASRIEKEESIFINQPSTIHLAAKYGHTVTLPCVIYRQNTIDLINVIFFIKKKHLNVLKCA